MASVRTSTQARRQSASRVPEMSSQSVPPLTPPSSRPSPPLSAPPSGRRFASPFVGFFFWPLLVLLLLAGFWATYAGAALPFLPVDRPFAAAHQRGELIVVVPPRPAPVLNVGKVDRSLRVPDPYAAALAFEIGEKLGLRIDFILAEGDAARNAIASGKADLAIAGLGFSPAAAVSFAPTSYASGRGVGLVLRHGPIQRWEQLADAAICAPAGSAFAANAATRYHARLQSYERPLDALIAFQSGECAALVDDEFVTRAALKQDDWQYYKPLPGTIAPAPAFIATSGGDAASVAFIDRTLHEWQRDRLPRKIRQKLANNLGFDLFVAQNDLYCH